jgi:hypothetical protein
MWQSRQERALKTEVFDPFRSNKKEDSPMRQSQQERRAEDCSRSVVDRATPALALEQRSRLSSSSVPSDSTRARENTRIALKTAVTPL